MSGNQEADEGSTASPSDLALADLLRRVENDSHIQDEIKNAFRADLKSIKASELANLKSTLTAKEPDDAS